MRNAALTALLSLFVVAPVHAQPAAGRAVDVPADDGTVLRGTYFAAAAPGPGVILFHMCRNDRRTWNGLAPLLVAKGIHVFTLDYRGYGESGGTPNAKWTAAERRDMLNQVFHADIDKAYAFFLSQPGVEEQRIGAGGASCGVDNAVQLARRHPEVKTLALLAGGTDQAGHAFLAKTSWMPLFGLAAKDDLTSLDDLGWTLRFSSNPQNQLVVPEAGGHGTELFAVHRELEPAIAAWFERHLVTRPVKAGGTAKPGPSVPLAAKLREKGGIAKLRGELKAAKRRGAQLMLPPEGAINGMGYEYLQVGRVDDAIEVLTLQTEAFPDSANAYDSLGDAYAAKGDKVKAAELAEKVLALMPTDRRLSAANRQNLRKVSEEKIRAAKK